MGTVYVAVREGSAAQAGDHDALRVVKRLRNDLSLQPALVESFLDEGRLAARLVHRNIVKTYDVGFDGHAYAIEMEYLEGQTLEALTRKHAPGGEKFPLAL